MERRKENLIVIFYFYISFWVVVYLKSSFVWRIDMKGIIRNKIRFLGDIWYLCYEYRENCIVSIKVKEI